MSDEQHSHLPRVEGSTPLEVIAQVSRVVSAVVDRITGDRVEVPLMVASAVVEGLKGFGVEARVMYGQAAWVEILEDMTPIWAGCWGTHIHFWAATQYGEIVDLNTSVAFRKRAQSDPTHKPLYSPPMLWSSELPGFYRYRPEGVAELDLQEERDLRQYGLVLDEVRAKCVPSAIAGKEAQFPNEPVLCPGRKLLDDSKQTFRHFDRALSVNGIPPAPPHFD